MSILDELRVGEVALVRAIVTDHLGGAAQVTAPTFSEIGSTGVVSLATSTSGAYYKRVTGTAPGLMTLQFSGSDAFSNGVEGTVPVRVLDASSIRISVTPFSGCTIANVGGSTGNVVHIRPNATSTGDPRITVNVQAIDTRRGGPIGYTYQLGEIVVNAPGNKVIFSTATSTGLTFGGFLTARGTDSITASATTVATSTAIVGSVRVEIISANTASLSTGTV